MGHNESDDLNPMHCIWAMTKVVFEHCVIYTWVASVIGLSLPQGHFQGTAGGYCTHKNNILWILCACLSQET
jgi:hypothetical protein